MADLYYNDGEGNMIKLANINSPSLTGSPIVPTPSGNKANQLVNVGYLKSYVSDKIRKYEFQYDDTQDYTLTVSPSLKYMVSVYGVINKSSTTTQMKVGYVIVTDENDNILAKSGKVSTLNLQQGYFPQSATMYVKAPSSGIFRAYVNHEGEGGKIKAQYILVVKADVTRIYRINITQVPNQTIVVTYNGIDFTEPFDLPDGSEYTVRLVPNTGYDAGVLNITSGTIDGEDVDITATAAKKKKFTVTITQSANQTIHVMHKGVDKTSTFTAEYGDEIDISITPNTGYNAGTVTPKGKVTVTSNVSVSATAAQIKKFTVSAQQFTEQTITMTRKDTNATSTTSWSNVPYNIQVTATIALKSAYANSHTKGTLNATSKTITANYQFTASGATWKTYKITIAKQTNQTITVYYTEPGGSKKKLVSSTSAAVPSPALKYGTTWEASVAGIGNYNPGTLSPGTRGTLTAATTITSSTAQPKDITITFTKVSNPKFKVTYTNGSGSSVSANNPSSIKIKKNTTITMVMTDATHVSFNSTPGKAMNIKIYFSQLVIEKNSTPIIVIYKNKNSGGIFGHGRVDYSYTGDLTNVSQVNTWTSPSISSNITYKVIHSIPSLKSSSSSYSEPSSGEGDGPAEGDGGHGGGGGDF